MKSKFRKIIVLLTCIMMMSNAFTVSAETESDADIVSNMMEIMFAGTESISGYSVATLDATVTTGQDVTNLAYISNGYYEKLINTDDLTHVTTDSMMETDSGYDCTIHSDLYALPSESGYTLYNDCTVNNDEAWQIAQISNDTLQKFFDFEWELDDEIYDLDDYDYYRLYNENNGITTSYMVDLDTGILTWIHVEAQDVNVSNEANIIMSLFGITNECDSFLINDFAFDCNLSYGTVESIEIPSEIQ